MDRDQRILSLEREVLYQATKLHRTLPKTVLKEDLIAAGWIGAIQAVDHFLEGKAGLWWYAQNRIRGEMLDYLRSLDELTREHRRDIKQGLLPKISIQSIDTLTIRAEPFQVVDIKALMSVVQIDTELTLRKMSIFLDERASDVLGMLFLQGMTVDEVAVRLGIGRDRLFQLVRCTLTQLAAIYAGKNCWCAWCGKSFPYTAVVYTGRIAHSRFCTRSCCQAYAADTRKRNKARLAKAAAA